VAGETPYQVGQLSPDGAWQWDGRQWVPVAAPGVSLQPSRRNRTWMWWVGGGCAILLVLSCGGAIWGMTSLVRSFQTGGLSCLPGDFPRYPGATVTRDYTFVGSGVAAGDSRECQETLDSSDDVPTVTNFYSKGLNSGDWRVTSNDKTTGQIKFSRASNPQNVGVIQFLGRGERTQIEIKFDS